METLSAKVPSELEDEIEEHAEEIDETRSVTTRKLLRDGLEAEEIRQENAELRQELEEREAGDKETIRLPKGPTAAAAGWIALLMVADGAGWINIQLEIGTAELGIATLVLIAGYAVYQRVTASTA